MKPNTKTANLIRNQQGLTIIELLACLLLVSLLGMGAYKMMSLFFKDWDYTSASQSPVLDANDTLTLISRDIRSAERPNKASLAVVTAADGSTLDVYRYNDGSYQRIQYRLYKENASDTTYLLQRGLVEGTDPGTSANPQYGSIAHWRTLLSGISSSDVFADVTSIENNERRSISISLTITDTKHNPELFSPLVISSIFMSRSQEIGGLSGGGGGAYVPVAGISLSPSSLSFTKSAGSKDITVTIYPDNASNQAVSCSASKSWITYSVSGNTITVTVPKNTTGSSRSGTLTVVTSDGGWTAAATISQAKN